ncbi:hypothetical protein Salat_2694500 [Sesamum alatum]|uniref:Reverse transcriptase zinc-binding domain-containing protein n=1 Tax=Sesamum alatum TaxID=300844 RepID=A0AAE1XQ10_9LAMI|nr:hypothetical protein Salat_2694500 [Sesamum alatum]
MGRLPPTKAISQERRGPREGERGLVEQDVEGDVRAKNTHAESPNLELHSILIASNPPVHSEGGGVVWRLTKNGIFTVRRAYKVAWSWAIAGWHPFSGDDDRGFWKKLWSSITPPRVRLQAWKLCFNAVRRWIIWLAGNLRWTHAVHSVWQPLRRQSMYYLSATTPEFFGRCLIYRGNSYWNGPGM